MTKTTFEMDGLFTKEDIDNRHFVMGQCLECKQWSKWDTRVGRWQCDFDKTYKYDITGSRSIRTWLVTKDLKVRRQKKVKLDNLL